MGIKYEITMEHPFSDGMLLYAVYCEIIGAVFNQKHERVYEVRWYNSEGERLFEEKCLPNWITPMITQEAPTISESPNTNNSDKCVSLW